MSKQGAMLGLLDELHATGCDGREFSTCRPVVVPAGGKETMFFDESRSSKIEVVHMVWCEECGAADYELV